MKQPGLLKEFLDQKVEQYNQSRFIVDDPIQIPHRFSRLQDIEISGFFAAIMAWGQRKTIIAKCSELLGLMEDQPHEFVLHHSSKDLKRLLAFKHRTLNPTDVLYFVHFFKEHYSKEKSLESAFTQGITTKERLIHFHQYFCSLPDFPARTRKHIATPDRKSACKRINMFLRWMVRQDNQGVDFGLWKSIKPSELICPIDLHVERVSRSLQLIKRKPLDWETVEELTANLRSLDPADPVKYDFALFGLGLEGYPGLKEH